MPIEVKEIIIQALIGSSGVFKKKTTKDIEKKKRTQLDVVDIVSKIMKDQKER